MAFRLCQDPVDRGSHRGSHRGGAAHGGELRSAKISTRKKDNKMVSAGFGFIECSSESVAKDVIKKMQGSALDGHNLVLQIAAAGARGRAVVGVR